MESALQIKIEYQRTMSLKEAVKRAYRLMNIKFYATDLINEVRLMTGRQEFDTTILRTLRKIRQEDSGQYGWSCIDLKKAIYLKTLLK
jgi:hypothetical protein